jgi:hypothetical protein
VGAVTYDNGQTDEGRAYLYLGSAGGLAASPAVTLEVNQAAALFGRVVASAGDVNGDGFGDVVVGAYLYDAGQSEEGRAWLYLGNGGDNTGGGLARRGLARQAPGGAAIAPWGTAAGTSFTVDRFARLPYGRARARLQVEVKPAGVSFNQTGLLTSASYVDIGTSAMASSTKMRTCLPRARRPATSASAWCVVQFRGPARRVGAPVAVTPTPIAMMVIPAPMSSAPTTDSACSDPQAVARRAYARATSRAPTAGSRWRWANPRREEHCCRSVSDGK